MIKFELVPKLSEQNPHLYQRDIEKVMKAILDTIAGALAQGGRAVLRGFGTFSVRQRNARKGRDPRTGEVVSVCEKTVPVFKASKDMRQRLNVSPNRAEKTATATEASFNRLVDA